MSSSEARLETLAETVVFAHDPDAAGLPARPDPTEASLESAAALAAAALAGNPQTPAHLRERLAAAGLAFCAERQAGRAPRRAQPAGAGVQAAAFLTPFPVSPRRAGALGFVTGLAAAAALWLLLRAAGAGAEDAMVDLFAADQGALRVEWKGGPSPLRGEVRGEVVWNQARQEGYLRFRGLPPLDADHRFQLWIVDGSREGAPVDGGLFEIADATSETVVPVRAKLKVGKPAAFVVTVEGRDGVVVSKQEHVVAIAGL